MSPTLTGPDPSTRVLPGPDQIRHHWSKRRTPGAEMPAGAKLLERMKAGKAAGSLKSQSFELTGNPDLPPSAPQVTAADAKHERLYVVTRRCLQSFAKATAGRANLRAAGWTEEVRLSRKSRLLLVTASRCARTFSSPSSLWRSLTPMLCRVTIGFEIWATISARRSNASAASR